MDFSGKIAVVTGGAGALGSCVARALFDAGAIVAAPLRSEGQVPAVLSSLAGPRLFTAAADLTDERQVRSFVARTVERFGAFEFLVNIAGGYAGGSAIENVPLQEWDLMIDTNLRTAFLMCRSALPYMRAQKSGRIITIAAMPALTSGAKKGPYAIAKRGVIALTETIADEVKGSGITANAIAPSIILTEANRQSMPSADVVRWVTPDEIASLVVYLCSPAARSISGNVIRIFGGV